MKICLIGDFSPNLDEGFKNTGHYLAHELEKEHTVYRINVKEITSFKVLSQIASIKPDVIHAIAQPTNQSFIFTYLLSKLWPKARTIVSALRPERYFAQGEISLFQEWLIKKTKPNLILVQSDDAQTQFESLGCTVSRLSNGVDLQKFKPASGDKRVKLRQKYGLDPVRPVVLHVGHLEPDRNLKALSPLPAAGIQVAVAGSLYMETHHHLINELESAGYHLFKGYQPNIAELYQLANYYVFPPKPGNSLAMPLSVLEAMACNLPIITTRFSGLTEAFPAGNSLKYVDHTDCFLSHIQQMQGRKVNTQTREMVKGYSWPAVADKLIHHYEGGLKS